MDAAETLVYSIRQACFEHSSFFYQKSVISFIQPRFQISSMTQVLYLRLGDETQASVFDDLYQSFCSEISEKYATIEARSAADTTPLLSSPSLKAILVVDAGLTIGKHHIALQKQLSAYAKAGGTVIFCCIFSGFVIPPDLDRMFRSFGLSWKFGSYHRTTFYLSQKIKSILGHQRAIELEREYSMKAVHLKNTPVDSRVYVPLEQSRTQSMVFAPGAVDQEEAPAVFSKHGLGWIGYVGDANNEAESQALVMALLGELSRVEHSQQDNTHHGLFKFYGPDRWAEDFILGLVEKAQFGLLP
ncbi:MAG: hypothetical protein Q9213_006591 [Squamulea squamosa]